jgi:hypothetical protein
MAVVIMYPEGTQGRTTATSLATKEVRSGTLSQARTVLADSRALAER